VCEFQHAAPHLVRSFLRFPLRVTECVADCVLFAVPKDAELFAAFLRDKICTAKGNRRAAGLGERGEDFDMNVNLVADKAPPSARPASVTSKVTTAAPFRGGAGRGSLLSWFTKINEARRQQL
jgi:hypothetical protein